MCEEIRIYVACLASYNNGILHGVWIDATQGLDYIQETVSDMLASSSEEGAEEYAIHDYEGYGSYSISEYEGLKSANDIALFIEEHGEVGAELLNYYADIEEAHKAMEEQYSGRYESLGDFAQELTEDSMQVPAHLAYYIDYEKMGRDMEMNGDVFTIETGYREVHVFWSR